MKILKNLILDSDFLGYPISLNFDRKGSTYKTVIGGCLSIIMVIFTIAYTIYGSIKINFHL